MLLLSVVALSCFGVLFGVVLVAGTVLGRCWVYVGYNSGSSSNSGSGSWGVVEGRGSSSRMRKDVR